MKLPLFIFMTILIAIVTSYSQDPFYINYTIDDGLPSNEVYDVEIDNDGMLWFTTDRGVCTYDSYQFTTYTTYDGLGDNVNFEIFKDSKGVLWFFGYNGKVTLYEDGVFSLYQYNDELNEMMKSLNGTHIKEINEGSDQRLHLVCDTQSGQNYFTLTKHTKPFISSVPKKNTIVQLDSFVIQFYLSEIHKKAKGSISYNIENFSLISSIAKTNNFSFVYDDENTIWFVNTTNPGLQQISKKTKKKSNLFQDFEVTNIRKDYNQGYWITTRKNGIIYAPNLNINFINTEELVGQKMKLLRFHKFHENLFCGTSSSSILVLGKDHKITKYNASRFNYSTDIDHFQSINNGNTLRFTGFEMDYIKDTILLRKTRLTRKNIIASNGDLVAKSLRQYLVFSQNDERYFDTKNKITTIIEDKNKNIWIGTLDGLIMIDSFDYDNPVDILDSQNESMGRISDIVVDKNNNVWICTIGNGIYLKTEKETFHFNSDNGLSSNIVNTLEVTNDNQIWVATNKGLNLISYNHTIKKTSFIESFDQSDGLNSRYINDVIHWNNNIYVATPNGLCYFPTNRISKRKKQTPLSINSVYVNNKKENKDSLTNLKYNENKINIKYTAIRHNKNNEQVLYRYSLVKNKEPQSWNYVNDREVIFDNLDHGSYIFEVNAVNKFGEWNAAGERISFVIPPHYSDTWWFKFLLLILIIATLFYISYYFFRRYQQIKTTELELEEARTTAKEAELSALRNQMNPHFIFNSLNTIQNFIFKKDVTKANYLLSKFSSLIRKSLNYSRLEAIPISEEIQFLKDYIELEKVRFPNLISTNFNIDESITPQIDKIPSLILQPLIENSIKHGISKLRQPGEISISLKRLDSQYLKIIIGDTGKGVSHKDEANISHTSLGHQILIDRIEILKSKGFPKTSFIINDSTSFSTTGYEVILILPIL